MKLKDHYDWICLGDHPGALLSACIMARLGYSVLSLKLSKGFQARLSSTGQCLDPETNYLLGLGQIGTTNGLLAQVLARLGVSVGDLELVESGEEVFPQVLTPESRVHLGLSNEEALRKELDRELGPELAKKSGLLSALSFTEPHAYSYWRGFPERIGGQKSKNNSGVVSRNPTIQKVRNFLVAQSMSAKGASRNWFSFKRRLSFLEQATHAEDLGNLCSGLWYGVTSVDSADPLLLDLIHSLVLARTGASFKGGVRAYREFLIGLARNLGAQVPSDTECRRFFVEGRRIIGVQITHRGKMIGASGGILGCSIHQARNFLYLSGKGQVTELKKPPEGKGWRFTLALTVHKEAISPGMTSRLIWKEKGAPALEIEVADPANYNLGMPDNRLVFVRTWLPFNQESLNTEFQRLTAARMFRQLNEVFPFLEFHVVRVYPDFRRENDAEHEFREAYGFTTPEEIPDNLRSVRGGGVGCFSGVDGLYVASGESYPSLGSFGPTVAALESVNHHLRQTEGPEDEKFLNLWTSLE